MTKMKHAAFMKLYAAVTGSSYKDRSVEDILGACNTARKHAEVYKAALIKRDADEMVRLTLEEGEW